MRPVTGSVDQFYQVPTVDGIVQALIQKQDGSGNVLTAEVYRNGTMVKNVSITAPTGYNRPRGRFEAGVTSKAADEEIILFLCEPACSTKRDNQKYSKCIRKKVLQE